MLNQLKETITKTFNYLNRTFGPRLSDKSPLSVRGDWGLAALLFLEAVSVIWLLVNLAGLTSALLTEMQSRKISEKKTSQVQANTQQIKSSPDAAQDLMESLPSGKSNYELLETLNSAAGANQVSLLSINFLPIKSSGLGGLSQQPVGISLQGNFENIFVFLEELEKNQKPVAAESLEITNNNKAAASGMVSANVVLKTYIAEVNP